MIIETTTLMSWKHFQARFAEWFNAAIVLGFGLYLILHPGMFTDPRVKALWSGLYAIASQETWGLIFLTVGMTRAAALYINGRHKRTPTVRLAASFFSAFLLTQLCLGLWTAGVPNTGLVVYPLLVMADIYSAFRASADMTYVARSDEQAEVTSESHRVVNLRQSA